MLFDVTNNVIYRINIASSFPSPKNFVKNSCNVRDQKTLSQLWDVFSGATQHQVVRPKVECEQDVLHDWVP